MIVRLKEIWTNWRQKYCRNRYRVIRCGPTAGSMTNWAQVRRWWFPVWMDLPDQAAITDKDKLVQFCHDHANGRGVKQVLVDLGKLP